MAPRLPRIWILTEPEHTKGPIEPIRRALGDVPRPHVGVQLRAKGVSDRKSLEWGHALRALTHRSDTRLTVNGRADIARRIGADGVHLGETAVPIERLRTDNASVGMIGASRHNRQGLLRAEAAGADYAFLSPLFFVSGKNPPLGIDAFGRAIEGLALAVYALGGIRREHVGTVMRSGAHGIAVRRAIYDSADPAATLDALLDELDKAPPLDR